MIWVEIQLKIVYNLKKILKSVFKLAFYVYSFEKIQIDIDSSNVKSYLFQKGKIEQLQSNDDIYEQPISPQIHKSLINKNYNSNSELPILSNYIEPKYNSVLGNIELFLLVVFFDNVIFEALEKVNNIS
jgi:hypothetical protein